MLTKLKKMYAGIFMFEKTTTGPNENVVTDTEKKSKHSRELLYHRDFKTSQLRKCQEPEHEFWIN
jgi:hypothetical protein